jgi:thiamine-monophosphate kinase
VVPPKPQPAPEGPRAGAAAPGGAREGEDAAIVRLAALLRTASGPPPPGEIWIGDDAAVVAAPRGRLVLSTDATVAGVHADLSLVGLDDFGWKALTAAVSDIGAMGARPVCALVTLCAPPGTDLDALTAGLAQASARWACPVVGGDLSTAEQVVVSVAVAGALDGGSPPVTRRGASPGDVLAVTGPLGGSAAGLRVLRAGGGATATGASGAVVKAHLRPAARLAEGRAARSAGATAMIDVSDGLSIDLHRLADASGVGFHLDSVPVAPGATREEALGGGEDYELVVAAADPDALIAAFTAQGLRPPEVVGRCVADRRDRRLEGEALPRTGWEHRMG